MRRPAPLARPRFLNFPSYDWFFGTSIICLGQTAGANGANKLSIKAHPGITVLIGRKTHRSQRTASGVFRLAPAYPGPASPSNPSEGLRQRETPSHARLCRAVIGSRSCQSKRRARLPHGPASSGVRAAIGWAPRLASPLATPIVTSPRGHVARGLPSGVSGPATPARGDGSAQPRARPGLVHGEVDLRSRAVHRLALWGSRGFGAGTAPTPGAPAPAARPRGGCDQTGLSGQHRPPRLCCPAPAAPGGVSPPARAGARPASSGRAGRRCAPTPSGSPPAPAAAAGSGTGQHRWGRGNSQHLSVTSLCHPRRCHDGACPVTPPVPRGPYLPKSDTQPPVTVPGPQAGGKAPPCTVCQSSCPLPKV